MIYIDRGSYIEMYPENDMDLETLYEEYGAPRDIKCWCVSKRTNSITGTESFVLSQFILWMQNRNYWFHRVAIGDAPIPVEPSEIRELSRQFVKSMIEASSLITPRR